MTAIMEFEDNTNRNNRVIQEALREIDTELLANAICNLAENEKQIIYRNLSKRAYKMLLEDVERKKGYISPEKEKESHELLLQLLRKHKKYYVDEAAQVNENEETAGLPAGEFCQIVSTLKKIAGLTRTHGFLYLEKIEENIVDPFLRKGLQFIIDGWEPMLARSVLEKYKEAYLKREEIRISMLIEGIESISFKEYPQVLEEKLKAMIVQ